MNSTEMEMACCITCCSSKWKHIVHFLLSGVAWDLSVLYITFYHCSFQFLCSITVVRYGQPCYTMLSTHAHKTNQMSYFLFGVNYHNVAFKYNSFIIQMMDDLPSFISKVLAINNFFSHSQSEQFWKQNTYQLCVVNA